MTTCTYSFQTSKGDETIKGMADMKAFLALNGVDAIVASGKPIFSREANSGKSIKKESIQNSVNELRKVWKNAPEIIVVQDMNDPAIRKAVRDENQRQLSQGAEGQPEGFFDSGRVYIVADEMKSPDDVARVVFHETLGHYGLRGVYGDKLDRVLDSVYMARRQLVLAKAAQYGLDFTKERDRRIASEEVLAEMAQTNPQAGLVQRAIAAIRQFLRDIGLNIELSDNDIVVNYLLPARNFVVNGVGGGGGGGSRFARSLQTSTEAFKKWFGNSKIVDSNGSPKVMYHGTAANFDTFKPKQAGAIFVTDNADFASGFSIMSDNWMKQRGMEGAQNVIPLFVKSEKPFDYLSKPDVDAVVNIVVEKWKKENPNENSNSHKLFLQGEFKNGDWTTIENPRVQEAIKSLGYDSFYVNEAGVRNLAVYNPNQIKSATGNNGDFDFNKDSIVFSRSQTDTPQFKAWFGDSKVVDADGKPMVVYHGTKSDIAAFSPTKGNGLLGDGIYTTADRKQASETYAGATSGSNVMPLYVSIQNPLVTEVGYDVPLNWQELGYDGVIYNKNNEPAWFVAANANQVKSAIGNNGDFNPNNPDIRFSRSNAQQSNLIPKWDAPTDNKLDDVVYALQDKHIDLKRVSQSIKKAGTDIADRWNAYLQEELYHGRTAKRTQDFIKDDLDPLIEDMRMRGVAMADFEEYLWARHAEERNIQIAKINPDMPDAGSGMSTKDARDYLAGLTAEQKANYQALAKRIDDINRKSRQVLVDYGLESKETIAAWEGAYKNYVPLMREDMDAGFGNGTGQGFSVKGNAAKRATGSNRAVVDVIANIAQQFEKNVIRGEKNRVSTALIGLAELNPNKEFWQVDNPPKIKTVSKTTGLVEEYTDPNYKNRNNVVVARTIGANGKVVERAVVFNQFDKRAMRMAGSIKNLDQDQVGELLGMASSFTRYFASINTQYNPIFGVINIVRDVQGALLNLSTTPIADKKADVIKNTPSALLGIYQDLRAARKGSAANSQWADLFEEFQNEGGQTGFRNMYANAQDRSEAIRNALDPLWWQNSTMGKLISANGMLAKPQQWMFEKAVKPIFDWLSDYNTSLENAVRLSVYKVALDNGHSKQQAASMAKNISVNFNRKGEMGRQIGALYAFFNASVQGTARIGETLLNRDDAGRLSLSTSGKRIVQGGLLLGAMQALLLASAGYSDDEPPEFVRDRSLIMPLDMFGADGKYLTLPMPLGFNAIPSLGRILTEWALSGGDKTQERLVHILDMVLNVTNPIGNAGLSLQTIAPTVIDPLAALAENKDFTGRPIAREDFNSLNPTAGFTRSRDKAWDFSVAIARAINWITGGNDYKQGAISPTADQLEYLAGQFTGGVGREIIKAGTTADSLLTGEDLPTYKIPLVGRFIGDSTGQASQGAEFYANVRTMNEYQNEIKGIVSQGGDVTAFMADHPEARMAKVADLALKQVQNLRKQQRALKEAGDSREQVTMIDERITAIMKRLNENVRVLKETAE